MSLYERLSKARGDEVDVIAPQPGEQQQRPVDPLTDLKRKRALGEPHAYLRDKVLAMLFFFSSTRTRASFEAGMAQLGGHAQFIESRTTQIAHGDTAKEIGEILGRYNDGIANYFEVLEAQQQFFPAELDLARTQRDELVAIVALYRALGGGWQLEKETS